MPDGQLPWMTVAQPASPEQLQAEVERLTAELATARLALIQRGDPMAHAALDSVDRWCDIAEQIGHPARAEAIALVKRWVSVQRRAEALAAGIVPAQHLPPDGTAT